MAALLGDDMRAQLFRQEVTARLSDGTGEFSAQRMLEVRAGACWCWPLVATSGCGVQAHTAAAFVVSLPWPALWPPLLHTLRAPACQPPLALWLPFNCSPQELPEQLGIDAKKAKRVVDELVKGRKQTTLVQVGGG